MSIFSLPEWIFVIAIGLLLGIAILLAFRSYRAKGVPTSSSIPTPPGFIHKAIADMESAFPTLSRASAGAPATAPSSPPSVEPPAAPPPTELTGYIAAQRSLLDTATAELQQRQANLKALEEAAARYGANS